MSQGEPEVRYERMRPHQIIAARDRVPVVYVPLGPLEWHGPHMPLGTDMIRPQHIAVEVAKQVGGVALPVIPLGSETYLEPDRVQHRGFDADARVIGMDFPGFSLPSLYIDDCVMGVMLHEVIRALKRQQFKVIVVVNGHGGWNHVATISRVVMEEMEPGKIAVIAPRPLTSPERVRGGHANRYEVGQMLAIDPETIDLSLLPPKPERLRNLEFGVLDGPTCKGNPLPDFTVRDDWDPRDSTVEEGVGEVEFAVQFFAKATREALATVQ